MSTSAGDTPLERRSSSGLMASLRKSGGVHAGRVKNFPAHRGALATQGGRTGLRESQGGDSTISLSTSAGGAAGVLGSSDDLMGMERMSASMKAEDLRAMVERIMREQAYAASGADAEGGQSADITWKALVAHDSRNAVVKILAQIIEFDFEFPFQRGGDGQAVGSGFFISDDGYIVTNAHVVESAVKLFVTVPEMGEERYEAKVIGVCFDSDLALLKSESAPVTKVLEIGNSDGVVYGQEVLTLGYPLGMESLKLTEGIISGRQQDLFQTDAPLNPGNSGGPMLNSEGKVIGINVAIVEGSNSVGFTIPSLQLTKILDFMKSRPADRRVVHKPQLGAQFTNSNASLLKYCGLGEDDKGIFVRNCYEGFPLYNAGVRAGDILHTFDGRKLDNFGQAAVEWNPYARSSIESLMALMTASSKVDIEYSTKGQKKTATLVFEDPENEGYPILPKVREWHPPYEVPDHEVVCGMVLMELTTNHVELFHESAPSASVIESLTPMVVSVEPRMKSSVVVTNVLVGSLASQVGVFGPGTLLKKVNDIEVHDLAGVRSALKHPVSGLKQGESGMFLTFMSSSNDFVVLDMHEALAEEFKLSTDYMYDISSSIGEALMVLSDEALDFVTDNDASIRMRADALIKKTKKKLAKAAKLAH